MNRALFLIIGGFVGAGKTTAIRKIARHLADRGLRVGLITNDQSHGLADTAWHLISPEGQAAASFSAPKPTWNRPCGGGLDAVSLGFVAAALS